MRDSMYTRLMSGFKRFFLFTVSLGKASKPRPLPTAEIKGHYFVGLEKSGGKVSIAELNKAFGKAKENSISANNQALVNP